jgi:hypothetical protein
MDLRITISTYTLDFQQAMQCRPWIPIDRNRPYLYLRQNGNKPEQTVNETGSAAVKNKGECKSAGNKLGAWPQ